MADEELRKEIVVEASPAVVFKALTDEEELVEWMPTGAKMDARVGGEYGFKYYSAREKYRQHRAGKRYSN